MQGEFVKRVALAGGDFRLAWALLGLVLLLYALSFAAFYPQVITATDEAIYIDQAQLLARGATSVSIVDPLTGEEQRMVLSHYPVGTALLMVPFVWLAGWQGTFAAPLLFTICGVLLTAGWIQQEGQSPIFALLVFGFPASMVLGRVPMSEPPSLLVVSLGLWLFWRGQDRSPIYWLGSSFLAGVSMIFREPNVLPFVAFFAGTLLRRETKCWALIVGGVAGLCVRLVASYLAFGDPFFVKNHYQLDLYTMDERLPIYLLGLLVLVPGGLVLSFCYRGRRRPELLVTVGLFFLFYLFQTCGMVNTGFVKRIVSALRYFIPLLPVMAFAMSESIPRLWTRFVAGRPESERPRLQTMASAVLASWILGVGVAGVACHVVFDYWSASQAAMKQAIWDRTGPDAVLVTNLASSRKFILKLDLRYLPLDQPGLPADAAERLLERHQEFVVVFLDRSDSAGSVQNAAGRDAFIASLPAPSLELDKHFTDTDHLRIWRVARAQP